MIARVWALLRCTHFEPSIGVTALATALALAAGRGAGTLLVAGAVLSGQFSIGWANDWLDADRDRAVGRRDKPVVRGVVSVAAVRRAALTSLAICVVLSLASGLVAGVLHLVAVAVAWAYDLGLKATPVSVAPYALAFGLLPAFIWLGAPAAALPPWWILVTAALLGAGAHFANALPDLADDARTGVRGLPHRLGARRSALAAAALLGAATATVAGGTAGGRSAALAVALAAAAALVVAVLAAGLRGPSRLAFRLTILAAVAVVAAFLLGGAA